MDSSNTDTANADTVFIDTLQVSATLGPDCWGRTRPQIVLISVYLHLIPAFLTAAGKSDDVKDSVHYGHLTKSITQLVENKGAEPFNGVRGLVDAVTKAAFALAGDAAWAVRVVVDIPKLVLLADGFSVDVTTKAASSCDESPFRVSVKDVVLAVIIGVNPPEREAKQRVITNIVFVENVGLHLPIDYPLIISKISQDIEASSYLTLEKFVMEIVIAACRASDAIKTVTVRAQKPSALTFAHSSGVEITRSRAFLDRQEYFDAL